MADKRAWAKFDVGYLDNPKMADVLDASCNAILMHFASVLYCSQHLTDGIVSFRAMERKCQGSASDTQLLIEKGLWHEPGHDCDTCEQPPEGKVYVHDFLEHNRDSGKVRATSEKRKAAANKRWNDDANSMQNALQKDDVCNAERERERETSSSEIATAIPRPEIESLLDSFDRNMESIGAKKPARSKANNTAIRLLIDKDGYSPEQIAWIMDWASKDEFWRTNILSPAKLRDKFDQLKLKAGVQTQNTSQGFNGEIDADAILGKDYWTCPMPPEDLSIQQEIVWKRQAVEKHRADRKQQALEKMKEQRNAGTL